MTKAIQHLNSISREEAETKLLLCCGSKEWARRITNHRPFRNLAELLETADRIWWDLSRQAWLEAFYEHPRIGESRAPQRDAGAETSRQDASPNAHRWSQEEQSAIGSASPETLATLADATSAYETRFGHIFLVCATGKSAEEILALLQRRLQNDPETELRIAAEEQQKITRLRLEKLLSET